MCVVCLCVSEVSFQCGLFVCVVLCICVLTLSLFRAPSVVSCDIVVCVCVCCSAGRDVQCVAEVMLLYVVFDLI